MIGGSTSLNDAGVSAREIEVLDLLGERLTNAEIGARLFISVRTVESHVSSLLRKLGVPDRRALAQSAAGLLAESTGTAVPVTEPALPSPLTSFVGRTAERTDLAAALKGQRLVTAVGPGGVGKTRLALAVAGDLADSYGDGVWYVDLVPVTDPTMIATSVAAALGLSDQPGRSMEQTVLARLADAEALVVLDNCEHLVDSVVLFVERLLASCPQVTVLATSRSRLLVPFERVFPVPGLSTASSDAVDLFLERASAVGAPPPSEDQLRRIAAICAKLDGMALAIELAAARLPTLGLDGLEAGLDDQLHVLAGRSRLDERHSSLRAALDWSHALLTPLEQAVLRRVSVFAAPFKVDDAAVVAGFAPVEPHDVAHALAQLAEQSLLLVASDPTGTRYRALETIRQYGTAMLDEAGESDETYQRHLRWCLDAAERLSATAGDETAEWRAAFDAAADDMRAALHRHPRDRTEAHRLAATLAGLAYNRGLVGECQQRLEEAAELAPHDDGAVDALRRAAGAAQSRQMGEETLRLHREAAGRARESGDLVRAATELATAATLVNRFHGIFDEPPGAGEAAALLAESHVLAVLARDDALDAALMAAEGFDADTRDPMCLLLNERALELSRRIGDPVLESTALDGLTAVYLANAEMELAVETTRRRLELMEPLALDPYSGFELLDAYQMATEAAIGTGDVPAARAYVEQLLNLPIYRNEGHLATSRLLLVEGLAGDWDRLLVASRRFLEGWERAGKPATANLSVGASAVAMVHGMQGDDAARAQWLGVVTALRHPNPHDEEPGMSSVAAFDAMIPLHRGDFAEAARIMGLAPEDIHEWHTGRWRQWHAAIWAEAAVLAGLPDAAGRVARARLVTAGNPIASAMTERAGVLLDGRDPARLVELARALDAADCRYQAARTLVFAGGDAAETGRIRLTALGASPMAT